MDALNAALNDGKVAVVHWCRERGCGDAIEEKANSSILGTEVRSPYVAATDGPCIVCGKPGQGNAGREGILIFIFATFGRCFCAKRPCSFLSVRRNR